MALDKPYSRPPVVEALLDIQIDAPSDFKTELLANCQKRVRKQYPQKRDGRPLSGEIDPARSLSASETSEPEGFLFVAENEERIFQAGRSGFTFNEVGRYSNWHSFLQEAQKLWAEYSDVVRPERYNRLSLRFINRFDFRMPLIDLETYFRTFPKIPNELPQLMEAFFFRYNLLIDEIDSAATITQTQIASGNPDTTSIILDVEVFRTDGLTRGTDVWSVFENLRVWKNKIFESCITDATREMII